MLDARTLSSDPNLSCDICIIGTGPAATTLAMELRASGRDIILLEAGGASAAKDDLDTIASTSRFGNVTEVRQDHLFGGNANAWSVHTPLSPRGVRFGLCNPADFLKQEHADSIGWPFDLDHLRPYYHRAMAHWKISPNAFHPADATSADAPIINCGADLTTEVFAFPTADTLLKEFRDSLDAVANVRIITNAYVSHLKYDGDTGTPSKIVVKSNHRDHFDVRARRIILATGGIETARLLLSSPTPQGHAIGNTYDQVGRYFMDHPLFEGGSLIPNDSSIFERAAFYDMGHRQSDILMGHFRLSDVALIRHRVPALSSILFPRSEHDPNRSNSSPRKQSGHRAALAVRTALEHRKAPRLGDIALAIAGADEVVRRLWQQRTNPQSNLGRGGWSQQQDLAHKYTCFDIIHQAEQMPHHDNRITLSAERNEFDVPKAQIDWTWRSDDQIALETAHDIVTAAFEQHGLGRVIDDRPEGAVRMITASSGHHMGTTRMGTDVRTSVVNENCRVHGTDNIFVLSSSVFPSGGYINPTLTIGALAIRLSDYLSNSVE